MKSGVYDVRLETSVAPERLLAAATDFSERRPDLWPTITRQRYPVFSVGDHSAETEEGTRPVHHRYRYAWTDDGVVRATTVDASAMATGSIWGCGCGQPKAVAARSTSTWRCGSRASCE